MNENGENRGIVTNHGDPKMREAGVFNFADLQEKAAAAGLRQRVEPIATEATPVIPEVQTVETASMPKTIQAEPQKITTDHGDPKMREAGVFNIADLQEKAAAAGLKQKKGLFQRILNKFRAK